MNSLLYKIPEHLIADVSSGKVELFGAILKEAASGRILGHVQQTGMFESLVSTVVSNASSLANPLGLLNAVQSQVVLSKLSAVQNSIGLLQTTQLANLACSGIGLSVTSVGFLILNKKLKAIQADLSELSQTVQDVTIERRIDSLNELMADTSAAVERVEAISLMKSPASQANIVINDLGRHRHQLALKVRELSKSGFDLDSSMHFLWALLRAHMVCSQSETKMYFLLDEIEAARSQAQKCALQLMDFGKQSPEDLARKMAHREDNLETFKTSRIQALENFNPLVSCVRSGIASLIGQSELAEHLLKAGVSGPEYLRSFEDTDKCEILYIPVPANS